MLTNKSVIGVVFDGKSSVAYTPEDIRSPIGTYGKSKALGEEAIEHKYYDCLCNQVLEKLIRLQLQLKGI